MTQNNILASTNPVQTVLDANSLGGLIGSIQVDLPGPAANPPYASSVDTFSATRASIFDDSVNGFASSNGASPTQVGFSLGSNTIGGTVSTDASINNTRNFYTFSIGAGQELASINLLENTVDLGSGSNAADPGFFALVSGNTAATPGSGFANLGGALFAPTDPFGTDLLGEISTGGISGGTGFSTIGPGDYTFVIQQTGNEVSNFLVDFVVVPEPSSAPLLGLMSVAVCLIGRRRRS